MSKSIQPEEIIEEEKMPISDKLDEYLKLRDFELEYSDERMEIFKGLDDDPIIVGYLNSGAYISNQVKKKKDRLSEADPNLRKLDSIAYYILKSDFRNEKHKNEFEEDTTGEILNNIKENNTAYKRDYKIIEKDRYYGYPIMSVYAMNRNRSDAPNNRKKETFIISEIQFRFGKKDNIIEEDACDILGNTSDRGNLVNNENTYERIIYSLKEPSNVLEYFRYELEVLAENDGDPSSEFYLISHIFEDIYNDLGFQSREYCIIGCLKEGKTYSEITSYLNEKYIEDSSFGKIRYEIETVLQKISDNIKNKLKNII